MTHRPFLHHLVCPWCNHGEVLADARASAILSIQCARCRKFYLVDLDTGKTERTQPQRRLGRMKDSRR